MNPTQYVLLILAGGAGTPLAVALAARQLVERHGVQAATAIRRTTTPTVDRPRELTR